MSAEAHGVEIFVALAPIDLRWGFDRLAGLVEEQVGRSSRCGALFLLFGKRRSALKILFFDGTGLCVFYKRLDKGTFRVPEAPEPSAACVEVEERVLDELLDGITVEMGNPRGRSKRRPRLH